MYEQTNKGLTVYLPKELDHHTADGIRKEVDKRIVEKGVSVVIFDFRNTTFMDSSGIGIILGRYRLVHVVGGGIYIVNASPRIQKIIHAAGLDRIVTFIN